jgi:steroid delta-isomerase-like uncharacterized protein
MSVEENKALVRRCVELWDERDAAAAGELYAPNYIYHGPGGREIRGWEGIKGLWAAFLAAFPDLRARIDDIVAGDDMVVMRWTIRGTHRGEFQGIAPTNKQVTCRAIEMLCAVDGMLVEAWEEYDQMGMLRQLGVLPPIGEGGE